MDLSAVTLEDLGKRHPEHALWATEWENYRLLYRGGTEFLRAAGQYVGSRATASTNTTGVTSVLAGQNQQRRFLFQLQGEPETKYVRRWEWSHYLGYLPAILDYFVHWLFSQPPIIRPTGGGEAPEWWEGFERDATGAGKRLPDVVRDAFRDALIVRRAGWIIGTPDLRTATMSQAIQDSRSIMASPASASAGPAP